MSIKPSSSSTPHISAEITPAKAEKATTPTVTSSVVNPEAVAKALKDYNKLKKNLKKPFMSGAAGLFTDNVNFPAELLDPLNPANDPKYLHLMSAMLGIKALEDYFATEEQAEEEFIDDESEGSDASLSQDTKAKVESKNKKI